MSKFRSRRAFLSAIGGSVAALPFLRVVENSYAQEEGGAALQRFIGVYHPHGIAAELFTRRDGETETEFDLGYADSPLQPFDDAQTYGKSFKDKLIAIEGLDLLSDTNAHNSAGTILTGSRIIDGDGGRPLNASIDQFLAIEQGLGDATAVSSVALAVGNAELSARETLSFGSGGIPVSKIIDPVAAFDFLFTQVIVGSSSEAKTDAERQRRLGRSLIDFVNSDLKRLRGRVGQYELQKVDQHVTALRELEKKFQAAQTADACKLPPRPTAFPALERYNGGEPYFDAITDLHIDLLAVALGCDITRFATLVMADLSYPDNPLGLPEDNHASVAHTYASSALGNEGRPVANEDPATWLPLAKFNRYAYGKVARLMQRLDEAGILDSTLLYVSSDMGNPAIHSTRNVPTLLAGGLGDKLRMGRRIKYRTDCPLGERCDATSDDYQTIPNNRLLVSIAQAFGSDLDEYGTQPYPTQGPLDL